MLCHAIQRHAESGTAHWMPHSQRIDVDKVSPSGVSSTSGNRRCDFLGEHHFQWVATHPQNTGQPPRQTDMPALRPNRIADVHIDVEANSGT
jgi:hypothetical protein